MIEKWGEKSKWRKRRNKLLETISLPTEGQVLDLSCGDGQFLELVHLLKPGLKLFGLDISEGKIIDAKNEYAWINFTLGSADLLSFNDHVFDVVFCNMALHHYDNPLKVLSESRKILKTGGSMYLMDLFPKNKLSQIIYNVRGCDEDYHFEKYYTLNELRRLAATSNLKMHKTTLLTTLPRLVVVELRHYSQYNR